MADAHEARECRDAERAHVARRIREPAAGGRCLMACIPHTEKAVAEMLATIGVAGIEQLFDEIPASLRVKSLAGIPPALNEMEIGRLMSARASADGRPLNFIGAGAYEHHIPSAVW